MVRGQVIGPRTSSLTAILPSRVLPMLVTMYFQVTVFLTGRRDIRAGRKIGVDAIGVFLDVDQRGLWGGIQNDTDFVRFGRTQRYVGGRIGRGEGERVPGNRPFGTAARRRTHRPVKGEGLTGSHSSGEVEAQRPYRVKSAGGISDQLGAVQPDGACRDDLRTAGVLVASNSRWIHPLAA